MITRGDSLDCRLLVILYLPPAADDGRAAMMHHCCRQSSEPSFEDEDTYTLGMSDYPESVIKELFRGRLLYVVQPHSDQSKF